VHLENINVFRKFVFYYTKLNSPKINIPMKKWANEQSFVKGRNPNGEKTHEEMLTILVHKGNANQNHIRIPPLSC
jgi:hypothetical protein